MAAAPKNGGSEKPNLELTPDEKRRTDAMCRSALLMAISIATCVPARAPMVLAIKNGDAAATAQTMGLMSTTAAALELLINPVLGRLSDKYGRKPFLLMATTVNAFLHTLVAANPNSLAMNIVDRSISGAMIFAFFNPMTAALQDMYAGQSLQKLGVVGAKLGASFGFGFALGPLIGAKCGGGKAFGVSAAGFALTAVSIASSFEETLPVEKRKEFDITAINPLSFLQLFKTAKMSKLMAAVGFNSFAEYANIYDINFLYLKTVMGYGQNEVGYFATGFGVTQIANSIISKSLIPKLGQEACTTLGNVAFILGFGLLGSAKSLTQLLLTLCCIMFGHGRSAYAGILLSEEATKMGMGRGEIGAASGNFLAFLKIIAPMLYGRLFAFGTSNGRNLPGLPYFLICILVACGQGSFKMALADKGN